jgi:hypothetical protein
VLEALCGAFNEGGAPGQSIPHARRIDVRIAAQTRVKSSQPTARTLRHVHPVQTPKGRHNAAASL